jgi:hypothetical protein
MLSSKPVINGCNVSYGGIPLRRSSCSVVIFSSPCQEIVGNMAMACASGLGFYNMIRYTIPSLPFVPCLPSPSSVAFVSL